MSHFQSTNVPEIPSFLRILATKKAHDIAKLDHKIKPLEQPNIIFGVGAGGSICVLYMIM
jgi:hypothetical protein